jgi:hypothetical protein
MEAGPSLASGRGGSSFEGSWSPTARLRGLTGGGLTDGAANGSGA